jgi:hypothetical protein
LVKSTVPPEKIALPDPLERLGTRGARRCCGERVLIWCDRAGPLDVFVRGREGQVASLLFVITGVVLVAAGAVIEIASP